MSPARRRATMRQYGQYLPTLLLFLQGVGVEETELTWKHSRSRTGAREVIFPSRLRARNGL